MAANYFRQLKLFCFLALAVIFIGCEVKVESSRNSSSIAPDIVDVELDVAAESKPSSYEFEPPAIVMADGKKIDVEEPGYACPTLFDIDKDGSEDLIVGQFNDGKMKWYRNLASPGESPKYAAGEWIHCGDVPAVVPGVS